MANSYKPQRSILRQMCVPLGVQTNPGQNMVDADFIRALLFEPNGFAQIKPGWESDYAYAGKSNSFASDTRTITYDSSLDMTTRLDYWLAGYLLAMVLGKDTFTPGVNPAPNSHVLTWLDTSDPAFCTNVWIKDTQGLQRRFIDMALNELVLTGSSKGSIMGKASWIGTGKYADGAIAPASLPVLEAHPQFLYGSDSIVSIGPTGAPVSFVPRVYSWEATFSRNIDVMRMTGSGEYAAFLANGNPTMKLKLVIGADDTTDIRDWMMNQTELEIKIATTSGAAGMILDWPLVVLPDADLGEQDKYVAYTLNLDENSLLKPVGAEAFTATVTNTVDQYLVAAAA